MLGLYHGRYLIAIYSKQGELVDVLTSLKEYKGDKTILCRLIRNNDPRVALIDCLERHDNCFAYEDYKFLEFIQETRPKTQKEQAHEALCHPCTLSRKISAIKRAEKGREL